MIKLGEFEELCLLTVIILGNFTKSSDLKDFIELKLGRSISIPAIHTVLKRSEKRGYLESKLTKSRKVRGGRAQRHFTVTQEGLEILKSKKNQSIRLYSMANLDNYNEH